MSRVTFPHLPTEAWELYLGGTLDDAQAARIEAHLEDCSDCVARLEDADPGFLVRRLREPAPSGTWDGFWEQLEPRLESPTREIPRPAWRRAWPAWAGVAAALVVGMTLVSLRGGGQQHGISVAPPDDHCPAEFASLKLTREECLALHGGPIAADEPVEKIVADTVDLRGL